MPEPRSLSRVAAAICEALAASARDGVPHDPARLTDEIDVIVWRAQTTPPEAMAFRWEELGEVLRHRGCSMDEDAPPWSAAVLAILRGEVSDA